MYGIHQHGTHWHVVLDAPPVLDDRPYHPWVFASRHLATSVAALLNAGVPPAEVRGMDADEIAARADHLVTTLVDPVGRREIAARAGVTTRTVDAWRDRHATFPAPALTISGAPVWEWRSVLDWLVATGRRDPAAGPRR